MSLRSLGKENTIVLNENTPLSEIYRLMAANGWDIKIEAMTLLWVQETCYNKTWNGTSREKQ